jgi:UDP-N-acetylmuramyl pentapeptide phosphotransferase/UDP-N-acetylglucosamine-1-phosphate transferase
LLLLFVATAALASVLTGFAIGYARRRRLLDLPGQRRSHSTPTPRGGGIAIVVATLLAWTALAVSAAKFAPLSALAPPIFSVALVGWLDDHGGLSARWRFAVHCIAAAWLLAAAIVPALSAAGGLPHGVPWGWSVALLAVAIAIVWSINLHNFMDGINGLLTCHAIFVFVVLAMLAGWRGADSAALLACAAACVGFLPFNFPHARVFMGDVASGAIGFLIAVAVLWFAVSPRMAALTGVVLCSAFVTDASCTLLSRMLRGRRWYSAHREHLYQWLVRSGFSHAGVVALYMGWNLFVALPVVCWMNRMPTYPMPSGTPLAAAVYVLAVTTWFHGKRWCLRHARERSGHAAA